MCDFQPGDVVVCVDDRPFSDLGEPVNPEVSRGSCYTVIDVRPNPDDPKRFGVWLSEVDSGPQYWGFRADRFRRVYRPDGTLISKLLQPVKEEA
jgi:hypothetical protein